MINNTVINSVRWGILLEMYSNQNLLVNNTVKKGGNYGIEISSGYDTVFRNNSVSNTDTGFFMQFTHNDILDHNYSGNNTYEAYHFNGADNQIVTNNIAKYIGGNGFFIYQNSNVTLINNTVQFSNKDAYFSSMGSNVTFQNNSFTTPSAPINVNGQFGSYKISLQWDAPNSSGQCHITNYNVYRSTSKDSGYILLTTVMNGPFVDNSISLNQSYYYIVSAINIIGEGVNSSPILVSTVVTSSAPTNTSSSSPNIKNTPFGTIFPFLALFSLIVLKRKRTRIE